MAKLLLVEDDPDGRDMLCDFLRRSGHTVECVNDGREALAAILATPMPDLVILDLLMPTMDGPSLLEVVRSYLRFRSLPVVVLTGIPDSPMVERVRAQKVNAILVKGKATPHDVLAAIEHELPRMPM